MQKSDNDEKSVATCILCGKLLKGLEIVKYRDWNAHAECAKSALEKQVDNFNRTPFWIGSVGAFFGMAMAFPVFLIPMYINDYSIYWIALLGMAICLFFQAFGLYGFASNYDEGTGLICSIISLASAIAHLFAASLFLQYGPNPLYYDEQSGLLVIYSIPNMDIALILSFGLLLLLMVFVAVMVLLLGQSVTFGFDNRIVAFLFVAAAALMPLIPLNFFIEMILVTILFLTAQVPKEWTKIEHE